MASFSGKVRGGSLNLRQSCSTGSTKLDSIPTGTNLTVSTVSGYKDWFQTTYNSKTGYVAAEFIAVTSGVSTVTVQTASGSLNVRKTPPSGTVIYTAAKGSTLYALDKTSVSGWYMVSGASGTGWASSEFLGAGSGSGTTTSYAFSASNAVTYALNHSANDSGACGKRNTSFPTIDGVDDCGDFVSQCICAGGAPMFNGWFYSGIIGTPSGWSGSKWTVTYSCYEKLNAKGWLQTVAYNAIKAGDIIYSYNKNASPTPYTHVTIAVSGNVTSGTKYGCNVCGYTVNQNNKFKELTADNCRCYRVKATLPGDGTEKKVYLPLTGSGGYAL